MRPIIKLLFLSIFFLLLTPNQLSAYNNSWSAHEDVTKPCPGPGCEEPCTFKCGCNEDGSPKPCCDKNPDTCCANHGGGPQLPPFGAVGGSKGSPVYLKSGLFTWGETDVTLVSKPTLKLTRNYTAFDPHLGLFGNSWISGFERLFIKTVKYTKDNVDIRSAQTYYILRQADSSRFYYQYNESNQSLVDMGDFKVKANYIDEHTATLNYANGMIETYEDGYLVKREDKKSIGVR